VSRTYRLAEPLQPCASQHRTTSDAPGVVDRGVDVRRVVWLPSIMIDRGARRIRGIRHDASLRVRV
jgi:hypothetical protein